MRGWVFARGGQHQQARQGLLKHRSELAGQPPDAAGLDLNTGIGVQIIGGLRKASAMAGRTAHQPCYRWATAVLDVQALI